MYLGPFPERVESVEVLADFLVFIPICALTLDRAIGSTHTPRTTLKPRLLFTSDIPAHPADRSHSSCSIPLSGPASGNTRERNTPGFFNQLLRSLELRSHHSPPIADCFGELLRYHRVFPRRHLATHEGILSVFDNLCSFLAIHDNQTLVENIHRFSASDALVPSEFEMYPLVGLSFFANRPHEGQYVTIAGWGHEMVNFAGHVLSKLKIMN